jgi:hypothetical protein
LQLRLDFSTFVIAGPSTSTYSLALTSGGSVVSTAGVAASHANTCLTDTFSISGVAGSNPPVICGTNSGYHGN